MSKLYKVVVLGLGGQGVLLAGRIIAEAAFQSGLEVSLLPSHGPEVHNGPVKSEIIISSEKILNPFINRADYVLVFHKFRLDEANKYLDNDSILLCKDFSTSSDSDYIGIKVNTESISESMNNQRYSNLTMVGALNHYSEIFDDKHLGDALKRVFIDKPYNLVNLNFKAYKLGKESQKALNSSNV